MNSTINLFMKWNWVWMAVGLGLATLSGYGQDGLKDLLYTVGTVTTNGAGADWAYILWGSGDAEQLAGRRFAVYSKSGAASAAAPFSLRARVGEVSEVTAASALFNRALNVGENVMILTNTLRGLFPDLNAFPGFTPAQQLAWSLQHAGDSVTNREYLQFAARVHPSVNLALGRGWAEPVPRNQPTTFEIREIDPSSGLDGAVVGRVTLVGGQPVILPAPDRPFQVADTSPMGDLNIRLRWAEPVELRRLALFSHGFNVWRVPRGLAVSRGWVENPPDSTVIANEPQAHRANSAPCFKRKDFAVGTGVGSAADLLSDPTTFFCADDNGLGTPGAKSFVDGEEFYYFVAARDLLGRDGALSKGGYGTACRRLPPPAPQRLLVENDYVPSRLEPQRLKLSWRQNAWTMESNRVPDVVTHYAIYRWTNHAQIYTNEYSPLGSLVRIIPHVSGQTEASLLDDGAGSPRVAVNGDQTFWYTVRAVKSNQCGLVFSGNSAPAFGVLRRRSGPDAPEGNVASSCGVLVTILTNAPRIALEANPDRTRVRFRLSCTRRDQSVAWAEFSISNALVGRVDFLRRGFAPGQSTLTMEYDHANGSLSPQSVISCRVGDFNERVSAFATASGFTQADPREFIQGADFLAGSLSRGSLSAGDPLLQSYLRFGVITPSQVNYWPNQQVQLCFNVDPFPLFLIQKLEVGSTVWRDIATTSLDGSRCAVFHDPSCHELERASWRAWPLRFDDAGDCDPVTRTGDDVNCLQVSMDLRPGTREWRIYRCLDDGPPTLISQGAAKYDATKAINRVSTCDSAMPPVTAVACYYGQLVDENGNASPMKRFGKPVRLIAPPPTPMLAPPENRGTLATPQIVLRWFCPPAGVERFRVHLVEKDAPAPSPGSSGAISSTQLTKKLAYAPMVREVLSSSAKYLLFIPEVFETGRVGGDFQSGPNFEITARVRAGVKYAIFVEALNGHPTPGASLVYEFTWQPPSEPQKVPWPARGLPATKSFDDSPSNAPLEADPRVYATLLRDPNFRLDTRYPVGIVIGEIPLLSRSASIAFNLGTTNLAGYSLRGPATVKLDPNQFAYHRFSKNPALDGNALLPIVVYRQQVTNEFYRRVSGTVLQVSPMVEQIPWRQQTINLFDGPIQALSIPDLLFGLVPIVQQRVEADFASHFGNFLVLRDTQPVMRGGRYRYFVVRFKENREVDQVIPAGEVELPFDL